LLFAENAVLFMDYPSQGVIDIVKLYFL